MTKQELRNKLKLVRENIPNKNEKDLSITKNFFNLNIKFNKALVFIKTGTEVETAYIINELLKKGIEVYAPKCSAVDNEMDFYKFNSLDELIKGKYGILEPHTNEKYDGSEAICLVPGLGFTLKGERIGYGKAYYDKFLAKNSVLSIGLCYNNQICCNIPTEKTDIKINILITETQEVICNGR